MSANQTISNPASPIYEAVKTNRTALQYLKDTVAAEAKNPLKRNLTLYAEAPFLSAAVAEYYDNKIREYHKKDDLSLADAVELLDLGIKTNETGLICQCFNCLKSADENVLDSIIGKYRRNIANPLARAVWFELLTKLGIKDNRIQAIIIRHLKLNRVEAVMAMGDYGDEFFIETLWELLKQSAEALCRRRCNPFAKFARLQNRSANLYIEALSAYIILKYKYSPCRAEYENTAKDLNNRLLPFAEDNRSYHREYLQSDINPYYKEAFIVFSSVLNIFSLESNPEKYFRLIGHFIGANLVLWEKGVNNIEAALEQELNCEDEDHQWEIVSTMASLQKFIAGCIEQNYFEGVKILLSMFDEVHHKSSKDKSFFYRNVKRGIDQALNLNDGSGNDKGYILSKMVEDWISIPRTKKRQSGIIAFQ